MFIKMRLEHFNIQTLIFDEAFIVKHYFSGREELQKLTCKVLMLNLTLLLGCSISKEGEINRLWLT